jgi:hypothetical protein
MVVAVGSGLGGARGVVLGGGRGFFWAVEAASAAASGVAASESGLGCLTVAACLSRELRDG